MLRSPQGSSARAGMVEDPALYRWSSYGEAMGGGAKGSGVKARGGLVRAVMAHKGYAADARHWAGTVSKEYRVILLAEGMDKLREEVDADGGWQVKVVRKGMKKAVAAEGFEDGGRPSRWVASGVFSKMIAFRGRVCWCMIRPHLKL